VQQAQQAGQKIRGRGDRQGRGKDGHGLHQLGHGDHSQAEFRRIRTVRRVLGSEGPAKRRNRIIIRRSVNRERWETIHIRTWRIRSWVNGAGASIATRLRWHNCRKKEDPGGVVDHKRADAM
jgi:hypothetical protein